jgi:hypothetical protein
MFAAFDAPSFLPPAWLPDALVSPQNVVTLRWASAGYATRSADDPADTVYQPRILDDVAISQSALDGIGMGGVVALGTGQIDLWDGDNALADLDRYGTGDGRALRLRLLPVRARNASDFGSPFTDAALFFSGVATTIRRAAGQRGQIAVSDVMERLTATLQPTLYLGTGGVEGGSDLKGAPKPVALGRVFNVTPVYLGVIDLGDGLLHTYQVHWRQVEAIDAVRIRGVAQTLVGTAPTVGQAKAWLTTGVFQLGATPDGAVTADVRGDAVGGYVGTTGGVIQRLLTSLGPQFSAAEFDLSAFGFVDGDLPGEIGWYGTAPGTAAQAAQDIVAGAGAVLCGNRAGQVRLFDPLARDVAQWALGIGQILDCAPVPLPASVSPHPIAAAVAWRRNWTLLQDVAASTPAADRQRLQAEASGPERVVTARAILRQARQRDLRLPGLYWSQADAAARAQKWADWLDHGPRAFRVLTDRYLGQVECGHIGRLTYPSHGLDAGALCVVLGWRETLIGRRLELTVVTIPEG